MALDNPPQESAGEKLVRFHTAVPDEQWRAYLNGIGVFSIDELAEIPAIDTTLLGLTSAEGVEYAKGLTSLTVHACSIPELKIAGLVNLQIVSARFNPLTALHVRKLVNLISLTISDGMIEQAGLERIIDDLWFNRVVLGANSCNIQMQSNPGSSAAAASMASEISDLIAAGCSVTI